MRGRRVRRQVVTHPLQRRSRSDDPDGWFAVRPPRVCGARLPPRRSHGRVRGQSGHGRAAVPLMGEAREIELGREYDQQIVAEMGLHPDPALQAYVQELGSRMAAKSERPHLPWTFRVVDDPVVNAFALPGGYIYMTRGILAHLNSEAELASVIGHEIGHVTARHSVNRMSKAMLTQLGLGAAAVLAPEFAGYAEAANAAFGLLFLKHGRDDERQSDDLGLRYMRAAGYDAREMAGVFEMLGRVSAASGGGSTPEWLSTHPNPENRSSRIAAQVAQLPDDFTGATVGRDEYIPASRRVGLRRRSAAGLLPR